MRIDNRAARYNYEIMEKFEAGIDLLGPEVKSVRAGQVSLNEAFVHLRDGQAYLVNAYIHATPPRPRKLLLHKKEILSLISRMATSNLTLVPLSVYNKGNIFKLEVGIAKGKKKWDKREAIKKRDIARELKISN